MAKSFADRIKELQAQVAKEEASLKKVGKGDAVSKKAKTFVSNGKKLSGELSGEED